MCSRERFGYPDIWNDPVRKALEETTLEAREKGTTMTPTIEFKAGKYVHYKGGHYSAIMLVAHHETREPMVVYVSQERGNVQVRELRQPSPRADGSWPHIDAWTDVVEWKVPLPDGSMATHGPRFIFVEDFK